MESMNLAGNVMFDLIKKNQFPGKVFHNFMTYAY